MNYQVNPYAAPQAAPPSAMGPAPAGTPQPWNVGEVVSIAWERFKPNWAVVVFTYLVTLVITQVVAGVPAVLEAAGVLGAKSAPAIVLRLAFTALNLVVAAFFQVGLTRIWLQIARGENPEFGVVFSGGDRMWACLGTLFLLGLIFGVGLLLLIVPGVIFLCGLLLSTFYVVDANMGPIAALQASWNATRGHKGNLFVLGLVAFGLAIAGFLMLCVGWLVTVPIGYIALTVAYTRISGLGVVPSPSVSPVGGPPPPYAPPPPQTGYGPPPGYGPPAGR
jgi:hypothetical protein